MQPYKSPILSAISNALGVLVLLAAIACLFLGVFSDALSSSLSKNAALGLTALLIISALIHFGTAQVIDFLGRSAHNTERLCHLLETSLDERLATLEKHLTSGAPLTVRIDNAPPPPGARPRYFYSVEGSRTGPLTAEEIRKLWGENIIRDHTPVLAEGEAQWRTYGELLSVRKDNRPSATT